MWHVGGMFKFLVQLAWGFAWDAVGGAWSLARRFASWACARCMGQSLKLSWCALRGHVQVMERGGMAPTPECEEEAAGGGDGSAGNSNPASRIRQTATATAASSESQTVASQITLKPSRQQTCPVGPDASAAAGAEPRGQQQGPAAAASAAAGVQAEPRLSEDYGLSGASHLEPVGKPGFSISLSNPLCQLFGLFQTRCMHTCGKCMRGS